MIHGPTGMQVGRMKVDVNWEASVSPCKKIRFQFDDKTEVIDREDLYALMMLFGDEKQQEELIPVVETKVRAITRLLKIRAKKDLRKGEIIAFPYTYYVPATIYERLLSSKDYLAPELSTEPDLSKIVNKEV